MHALAARRAAIGADRPVTSPCYNLIVIRIGVGLPTGVLAPIAAGLLFAAAVMVPAYGPLIDHHYAERLPFHGHIARDGPHSHSYLELHAHPMPAPAEPDMTTAIPGEDGLPSSPLGVGDDRGLLIRSAIEPPVSLDQPMARLSRLEQFGPSPPVRPPRISV